MVNGVVYSTAGTRRAVVALDAGTGEMLWMHSENEGKRGESAPRQLSGRGLAYWPGSGGQGARIVYVTPGYQMVALDAKTGVPAAGLRQERHRRSEDGERSADRSDHRRDRPARHADHREGRDRRRRGAPARRRAQEPHPREGLHPRLRRAHRQAAVDLPHDSARRRVRQRHVGEGLVVVHRQRRRLGADDRSTKRTNLVFLPVELPTGDYYGGHHPGQQPLRRKHRRARPEDRPAQVALPAGAPRHLGHGHPVRADPDGPHRRRPRRSRRSDSRPSRDGSTPSIASPANRCGRSKSGRSKRAPCRASGMRRRSRSSPSRRRSNGRALSIDDLIDFTPELRPKP